MGRKKKIVDNTTNKSIPTTDGVEFCIKTSEVLERENFGSFELIKTKGGIMFKNYTGFHVWTTRYAVGYDRKVGEYTLYQALDELFRLKKLAAEAPYADYVDGLSNKAAFVNLSIVVQANLTQPMTIFQDKRKATENACKYMDWLKEMEEKLKESSSKLMEEDLKKTALFEADLQNSAQIKDILGDAKNK